MLASAAAPRVSADDGKPDPLLAQFTKDVQPALQQYCVRCHKSGTASAGGVDLTVFPSVTAIQRNPEVWRKVAHQITTRTMPPPSEPQPAAELRGQLTDWINRTLDAADDSLIPKSPGRVTIHRLSRLEYNNTIRDLLGVDTRPADSFPADGGGGSGFDNNADTLFVPPILMERYVTTAAAVLHAAKSERVLFSKPDPAHGVSKEVAARKTLAHFAMLGYRRPPSPSDIERLLGLYRKATARGLSFDEAVRYAMSGVLVSPRFLFRVEADHPPVAHPQPQKGVVSYPISDYELASRLSYFLWASMPDQQLFELASKGTLHRPETLDRQVGRMLADPKARSFADSFAGQWLRVRDLYTSAQPDPNRFPTFTPGLRDAMYNETIEFVNSIFRDNSSVLDLIDSDYTYLNKELADYYHIPDVTGTDMRKVALPDRKRGGVLTMASVLTVTSYAERTSPVLRGKWVLEQVLGTPPPPPPPNAGGLSQDDTVVAGLSFRQRLEKHREKPQCRSCHSSMDPIGFGLENFDAIGRWRSEIGGRPVDASGVLSDGAKFSGPVELKQHILLGKQEFVRNLTDKMLGFALGRGLEEYDRPSIRHISQAVAQDGFRSGTLIREIVKSYPFLYRTQ